MRPLPTLAAALAASLAVVAPAQQTPPAGISAATSPAAPPYAFLADLTAASPVIADATVRSATRIKEAAPGPNLSRFYVEADVLSLVKGEGGLPPRVGYLVDAPDGPDGRPLKLKRLRVLLFARPAAGRAAGQLQLVSPDAQVDWSPAADARVRAIARAQLAADAPPHVTGVGNVFHVPGSLPGEGETQIFLHTANGRPVSLSVLRRPGERPTWAVALSEIVDEAAHPPARDTLLWYRLACFLPRALPDESVGSLAAADADAAREDYRFVLEQLGPCGRRARLGEAAARVSGGDGPA